MYCFTGACLTFANIVNTSRGHRRLICNGFRFGELPTTGNAVRWRCTALETKTKKRCNAKLTTKMIDGYEMIEATYTAHNHAKPR